MPLYDIAGVPVDFPFEAYSVQLVYMEKVVLHSSRVPMRYSRARLALVRLYAYCAPHWLAPCTESSVCKELRVLHPEAQDSQTQLR